MHLRIFYQEPVRTRLHNLKGLVVSCVQKEKEEEKYKNRKIVKAKKSLLRKYVVTVSCTCPYVTYTRTVNNKAVTDTTEINSTIIMYNG